MAWMINNNHNNNNTNNNHKNSQKYKLVKNLNKIK